MANENSGIIFKNDRKANDKAPDYKGKGEYNGVQFEMALWVKEGKKGKFFSVKFSPPYIKPDQATNTPDLQEGDANGENLPF